MEFLLPFYVAAGLLLVVLSIPLWLRRVPPNGLYGVRIRATLNNPTLWYAANRYFAPRLAATGLATAAAAIALAQIRSLSLDAYAVGVLVVFILFFAAGLAQTLRKIAKDEHRTS